MSAPVLILLYKKPKTTVQVINALKKVKPKLIYIAINIPPINKNKQDYIDYKKVLKLLDKIDWKCDLKIKKRKKHLSPYDSYKSAINWFFKNEKEGIILEDDTVPNKSFFTFCNQMLKKYRNNNRIALISGTSFYKKENLNKETYFFSNIPFMWGYATWKRTILGRDEKMKNWPKNKKDVFNKITSDKFFIKYWSKMFNDLYNKKFIAYDFQMAYSNFKNKKLTIFPKKNLVKNIGFGNNATHTKSEEWYSNLETYELKNIKHPKQISPDLSYDEWVNLNFFQIKHFYFIKRLKKYKIFKSKIILRISKNAYRLIKYIYRLKKQY